LGEPIILHLPPKGREVFDFSNAPILIIPTCQQDLDRFYDSEKIKNEVKTQGNCHHQPFLK